MSPPIAVHGYRDGCWIVVTAQTAAANFVLDARIQTSDTASNGGRPSIRPQVRIETNVRGGSSVRVTETIPEIIAYAKANPGKLNMASPGIGTGPHVAGELFKMMAGVNMVHVPYRGTAAALTDLLAGQVQVMFPGPNAAIEQIRNGALRPLAVTTATRWEALPEIPTIGEFVPGYEASAFWGVGAPRNTPAEIIDKLNKEINTGLSDPTLRGRLLDGGGALLAGSPADFGKVIADETEKWAKVVKFAGIRP